MSKNSLTVYATAATIICGWWLFAFYPVSSAPIPEPKAELRYSLPFTPNWTRENLRTALLGDRAIMQQLLRSWEGEQEALIANGAAEKRLGDTTALEQALSVSPVPSQAKKSYFPQTYAAAAFLLTLVEPEQICAIPTLMRRHCDLFPTALCQKITGTANRYRSERLALHNPCAAFVSSYSDPFTLDILEQQRIPVVKLVAENTLPSIQEAISQVGKTIGNVDKAQELSLFLEAAMQALDNRAQWLLSQRNDSLLIACHQMELHLPTSKSLTGYLLKRMGLPVQEGSSFWKIPLTDEKLLTIAPETLILITGNPATTRLYLTHTRALTQVPALTSGNYTFIADHVQNQSNQFIALAYFDLVEALQR